MSGVEPERKCPVCDAAGHADHASYVAGFEHGIRAMEHPYRIAAVNAEHQRDAERERAERAEAEVERLKAALTFYGSQPILTLKARFDAERKRAERAEAALRQIAERANVPADSGERCVVRLQWVHERASNAGRER